MDRRNFISTVAGVLGTTLLPAENLLAAYPSLSFDLSKGIRTLNLYRPATKEKLNGVYMREGVWVPGAYERICHFLRDVKENLAVQMDPTLIAILDWVQRYLLSYGYKQPIHITSGYRSPRTNSKLEGAAKNSQHLHGKAVDIVIPGVSATYVGELMRWLSQGGVGTYDKRGFVHIDTGTVRAWRG